MKILTWNCNLVLRKDFELIRHFDSDIIIIQECEKLDLNQFEGYKSHWIGAGDFNNAPQFDIPNNKNNFVDINYRFSEFGLSSAYHKFSEEPIGSESAYTYFHQKNPSKGFHIDYIYTNFRTVGSVEIGKFEDWISVSDHVPIISKFN